jgi:pimeloyl-ACP methyl ester carboxylesterase
MIREAHVSIGDTPVRYLEAGSGRPVVLLHAFPLDADMWRPQLEHPPAGWRLVAPDYRGFGKTRGDDPGRRATIDDFARDIKILLERLEIDRGVIGGLSMGGYVAFALFRQAPELFSGIVLADTRPGADSVDGRAARQAMLELVRSRGPAAVAEQVIPKLLGATTVRERPEIVSQVRRTIESTPPTAIARAIEAMMDRPDSTADLSRLTCPALIVVGEEDLLTPPAEAEAMHRRMPHARLVVLPAAGHLSNLEAAGPFSRALSDFLGTA